MRLRKTIRHLGGRIIRFGMNLIDSSAVVLLYHRVTELNDDHQLLAVRPSNFYQQIEYLKKNYNVLPIEEFCHILKRKRKFPRGSIIITFDDGYSDNYTTAMPMLESLKVQALFYITTSLLETRQEFWWDQLERIIFSNNKIPNNLNIT